MLAPTPPRVAIIAVVNVLPGGIATHVPWVRVGGTNSGPAVHGWSGLVMSTRNCRATLLRGVVDQGKKSSIMMATACNSVGRGSGSRVGL